MARLLAVAAYPKRDNFGDIKAATDDSNRRVPRTLYISYPIICGLLSLHKTLYF